MGKTSVFMRTRVYDALERARDERLKSFAATMQKHARGFLDRRRYAKHRSLINSLMLATKTMDEAALEKAILDAGGLPYNGFHLKQMQVCYIVLQIRRNEIAHARQNTHMQDAREALALLRAQQRARRMLEKSMAAREIQVLEGALDATIAVKIKPTEALVVQAKALLVTLIAERDLKAFLRQAVIARDLAVIEEGLFRASQVLSFLWMRMIKEKKLKN